MKKVLKIMIVGILALIVFSLNGSEVKAQASVDENFGNEAAFESAG